MTPGIYNFPDQTQGTTFDGVEFQVNVDDVAMNLAGVTIKVVMRSSLNNQIFLKQAGSGITVTDAAAGIFRIDPFAITYPIGTYSYDITFVFTSGAIKTYIKGTIKIISAR